MVSFAKSSHKINSDHQSTGELVSGSVTIEQAVKTCSMDFINVVLTEFLKGYFIIINIRMAENVHIM